VALEFFAPGVGWFDDVQVDATLEKPQVLTPDVRAIGPEGLDVSFGAERHVVSFGEPETMREYRSLRTDGALAVVSVNADGQPTAAFVQEGTLVEWEGREVLRLPEPGTAEAEVQG
jgi:hypothetical protein